MDRSNSPDLESCEESDSLLICKIEGEDAPNSVASDTSRHPTAWELINSAQHVFLPSLEGLRGVAVSMTVVGHVLDKPWLLQEVLGATGVDMFFVLSGFLITGVLIRLQDKQGSTTARRLAIFYSDRFVRLGPALTFMISTMSLLYLWRGDDFSYIFRYALLAFLYIYNIQSFWSNGSWGPWGNVWSLAVEEQFYIFWSLSLPYLLRCSSRNRVLIIATLISLSYGLRFFSGMFVGSFFGIHWYSNSLTNFWKMLLGASLRLVPIPPIMRKKVCAWIGSCTLLATLVIISFAPWPDYGRLVQGWGVVPATQSWTDLLTAFSTLLIISGAHEKGFPPLEHRSIRFVGKISYAWYLWQVPIMNYKGYGRNYWGVSNSAVAFIVAMISTFWIEEPIRKAYANFKKRYTL